MVSTLKSFQTKPLRQEGSDCGDAVPTAFFPKSSCWIVKLRKVSFLVKLKMYDFVEADVPENSIAFEIFK